MEEIDDNEFYQQDFTTASEWEIFNARLEEQFHEWKLPFVEAKANLNKNELSLCEWSVARETLFFADSELVIARYCAKTADELGPVEKQKSTACQAFNDLVSLANNFCILDEKSDEIHPIARWYGLRDFVVVYPSKKAITNESQIRVLLSSIHIAGNQQLCRVLHSVYLNRFFFIHLLTVAESNCDVPVFVQVLENRQNVFLGELMHIPGRWAMFNRILVIFLGVCETRTTRLTFDIVHLSSTPPTCKYLSGLLDMFKGKIGVPYNDPVVVSLRLTYSLNRFFCPSLSTQTTDGAGNHLTSLPWGATIDPITDSPLDPVTEILLYCDWNQVAENVVLDSQNHSDFNALLAPKWSLRARFQDSTEICYLMREMLAEYIQLNEKTHTLFDIFGDTFAYGSNDGNPLDLLTESKISKILPNFPSSKAYDQKSQMQNKRSIDGPIPEDVLTAMLYFMFPDAEQGSVNTYDCFDRDSVSCAVN